MTLTDSSVIAFDVHPIGEAPNPIIMTDAVLVNDKQWALTDPSIDCDWWWPLADIYTRPGWRTTGAQNINIAWSDNRWITFPFLNQRKMQGLKMVADSRGQGKSDSIGRVMTQKEIAIG